jgi:hypothetical protein
MDNKASQDRQQLVSTAIHLAGGKAERHPLTSVQTASSQAGTAFSVI